MKTERVETDVLVVGGGIAGLMAAIRARETGADVVVRPGSAAVDRCDLDGDSVVGDAQPMTGDAFPGRR